MHSALDIVRAAIPDATCAVAENILWERTCFPVGRVTARDLYRAASRVRRCAAQGTRMCDFCDRLVGDEAKLCARCERALRLAVESTEGSHDDSSRPAQRAGDV